MKSKPISIQDFSRGRVSPSLVGPMLIPKNSVKDSLNVDYDVVVGSGIVRSGSRFLGAKNLQPFAGDNPKGLSCFGKGDVTKNRVLAVFDNTLYSYGNPLLTWHTSNLTALTGTAFTFAYLNGSAFTTSKADGMYSSADADTWTAGTAASCIDSAQVKPSLLFRYAGRLLAAGDVNYRSRVYFSSIVDPAATPFITWNTNSSSGDWIDVNPDDGGTIQGFSEASTYCLVFKDTGVYRLDTINRTTNPENIYNVGLTSSSPAHGLVVSCLGQTYFCDETYHFWRTDGGYPQQLGRFEIQDILGEVSGSTGGPLAMGTDGLNVFISLSTDVSNNVTFNTGEDTQISIKNPVLKYSVRDNSWSLRSYPTELDYFANCFTFGNDSVASSPLIVSDDSGQVLQLDYGTQDLAAYAGETASPVPIYYSLETQDIDFGDRSHQNQVSNRITAFTKNGSDSSLLCRLNGGVDVVPISIDLSGRVSIGQNINLRGSFFNFIWSGSSSGTAPIFEGIQIEDVDDLGNIL